MQSLTFRQLNQIHSRDNATEAIHGARAGEYIRDVVFSANDGLITTFAVGSLRTFVTKRHWFRSGIEMLLVGRTAAVAAYAVGTWLATGGRGILPT